MKIKVGTKEFKIKVADTDEGRQRGLKRVKSLPKDSGLVLKFDSPTLVTITMLEVRFPLDLVFISNLKVVDVKSAQPEVEKIVSNNLSDYVLEVNEGEAKGIKPGDLVSFVGEKKEDGIITKADGGVIDKGALQVLDENGVAQANLEGDERIFSRKHTTTLCDLAKTASESKSDSDYKKLGQAMLKMIEKQDTQEQEYVKS